MTFFDAAAFSQIIYDRLALDAEGAPVRAALGAGTGGIISVAALGLTPLPARPFVALKAGPVPQMNAVVRAPSWTWFIYDDPAQFYARVDTVATLVARAYLARLLATPGGGELNDMPFIALGAQFPDPILGLMSRTVQLTLYTR